MIQYVPSIFLVPPREQEKKPIELIIGVKEQDAMKYYEKRRKVAERTR